MALREIGRGTTNAQGIATMTTDYVGVGAGRLQIIAKAGGIYSEVYELLDCVAYDSGVAGTAVNQYWLSAGNIARETPDAEGTLFSNSASGMQYVYFLPKGVTANSHDTATVYEVGDYCVEVDVVSYDDNSNSYAIRGLSGASPVSRTISQLSSASSFHIRTEIKDSVVKHYIDNSDTPVYTSSQVNFGSHIGVRFGIQSGKTLKLKNFKVYPI